MYGDKPLLGVFDKTVLKKRHSYRLDMAKQLESKSSSEKMLYSYDFLLDRIYKILKSQNPNFGSDQSKQIKMPPPSVESKGKKTFIANFKAICDAMKRDPEHVKQYICSEQNANGTINAEGALTLATRLNQTSIEKHIFSYIKTYLRCPVCGSTNTVLEKRDRLLFLHCNDCTSSRTVSQIQEGYKANLVKRKLRH